MSLWLRGLVWFGLYVAVTLVPLGVALATAPSGAPRPAAVELSVALGLLAFPVILFQFALVSRLRASSRPFGTDALLQFHQQITGWSPLWSQQHPLSIASSAERAADGGLEFSVKALGDWSGRIVPGLAPGARVWVDGPFGAFTTERAPGQGFVFIAGGIGIAPIRSMLLTMGDRGDRRDAILFYAAHDASRLVFASELEALDGTLNLRVVYVFEAPPPAWTGERGHITVELLRRHLPKQFRRYHYYVCGPVPMMNAMEATLTSLGIPSGAVETERFNMV